MHASLSQLAVLQRLDEALARLESERASTLPERRAAAEAERAAGEQAVAKAKEAIEARRAERAALEKKVELLQARTLELKTEQGKTKDNALYRVLDAQIEALPKQIGAFDEPILESMYAIEEAEKALAAERKRSEAIGQRVAAELTRLDGRVGEIEKDRERLEGARSEALSRLDPELRSRYEKVATRTRPALVLVATDTCPACKYSIPPQDHMELRAATRLVACGRCRRLLIHASLAPAAPV